MSDTPFDFDFEELVRDVQGRPRDYAVQITTLRARVAELTERLEKMTALPQQWREDYFLEDNTTQYEVERCAKELEAALKEKDDE